MGVVDMRLEVPGEGLSDFQYTEILFHLTVSYSVEILLDGVKSFLRRKEGSRPF